MKTMTVSNFKVHALKVIDRVSKTNEKVVITKRGKAVAELIPIHTTDKEAIPGKLSSTLIFENDIVTPLGAKMWEVCK